MCVCRKEHDSQDFNQNGLGALVSEANAERFVFRARAGPLCSSECSKMHLCGHHERAETVIGRFLLVSLMCAQQRLWIP